MPRFFVPAVPVAALALCVAGGAAHADLITPVSASSDATANTDTGLGASVTALIDGVGFTGTITESNYGSMSLPSGNSYNQYWVTVAASTNNYFSSEPNPVIVFDLGDEFYLTDLVAWRYRPVGNASAQTIDVDVSTDGTTWSDAATITLGNTENVGMRRSLGDTFTATHVRFTVTDNFGANRVGLGEVRFLGNPVPEPASLILLAPLAVAAGRRCR